MQGSKNILLETFFLRTSIRSELQHVDQQPNYVSRFILEDFRCQFNGTQIFICKLQSLFLSFFLNTSNRTLLCSAYNALCNAQCAWTLSTSEFQILWLLDAIHHHIFLSKTLVFTVFSPIKLYYYNNNYYFSDFSIQFFLLFTYKVQFVYNGVLYSVHCTRRCTF